MMRKFVLTTLLGSALTLVAGDFVPPLPASTLRQYYQPQQQQQQPFYGNNPRYGNNNQQYYQQPGQTETQPESVASQESPQDYYKNYVQNLIDNLQKYKVDFQESLYKSIFQSKESYVNQVNKAINASSNFLQSKAARGNQALVNCTNNVRDALQNLSMSALDELDNCVSDINPHAEHVVAILDNISNLGVTVQSRIEELFGQCSPQGSFAAKQCLNKANNQANELANAYAKAYLTPGSVDSYYLLNFQLVTQPCFVAVGTRNIQQVKALQRSC